MGRFAINRRLPMILGWGFKRLDQIPDFDRALVTAAVGFMVPVALTFAVKTNARQR